MKLDILAFAAHPDDTELSCAGTLARHAEKGHRVGVADLTRGELGTRGTPEIRETEAQSSAKVLGLAVRDNLELPDGFFLNAKESQLQLIRTIRHYRPEIVLLNAPSDRHPDHGRAAKLAADACFLAGLEKVKTTDTDGRQQPPWRPKAKYHYIQSQYIVPDFVVDISSVWEKKKEAIACFRSQFYDPQSTEPETFISSPEFLPFVESRAREYGHSIGVKFGEGFVKTADLGIDNLFDFI